MIESGAIMHKFFKEHNKYIDLFNLGEFEGKFSFFGTLITIGLLLLIKYYSNFIELQPVIMNLLLYIISGLFGILGFTLAGLAIIIGLFKKEVADAIKRRTDKKPIENVMSSFQFQSVVIIVMLAISFFVYLLLGSEIPLLPSYIVYPVTALYVYLVFFVLSYTVALIYNCVQLYQIYLNYSVVNEVEKTFIDRCNEVRIDYILKTLIDGYGIENDEFKRTLIEYTQSAELKDTEKIVKYFNDYYVDENKIN